MASTFNPFVYWAQDENNVYMRVELHDVEQLNVDFLPYSICLQAIGVGSRGKNEYAFSFDLYAKVDNEISFYKKTSKSIDLTIVKMPTPNAKTEYWQRLTSEKMKLSWLKVDFERFKDPDMSSDDESMPMVQNVQPDGRSDEKQAQDIVNQLLKEHGADKMVPDLKKNYLILFNVLLFLGFFLLVLELLVGYVYHGTDYFPTVWASVSPKLYCCQIAQWFEVVHSMCGWSKGGSFETFCQNFGRSIILFVVLRGETRLHDKPFVFYLFLTWSIIEIFRYSYYSLSVLNKSVGVVTWLRYTMWIPLYPIGLILEGVILIRSIPYYMETEKYSFFLPNCTNFSFYFPYFIQAYLVFGLMPGVCYLMMHLKRQRNRKIGVGPVKKPKIK